MSQQYGPNWRPHHPQQPHGPQPVPSNTGLTVLWAMVPLFTCGFGTPFIMGFAARRLRSVPLVFATALYTLGMGVFVIGAGTYGDSDLIPGWLNAVLTIGLLGSWLGGMIHALIIRGSVFRQQPGIQQVHHAPAHPSAGPYPPPVATTQPSHMHTPIPPQHHFQSQPTQGHHPQDQHVRQPQPAPAPNGWIGPYRLIGSLGKGGQGTVHLALTPQGQKVAIKVLHEHFVGDRAARERFLREVEATRKVATFSTARVLDVSINDDQAYVVSEYVDGVSLEQLVRDRGPRDGDGLTRLALSTAGALAAIHRAGIVHRDFKPANVLIGADGPRVIDFGIARALDQVTATSSVMGTPAYMSPEQLAGGHVGPESDVFSWASTMIYAASGRVAFGSDTIPAILNRVINHQPDLSPLPPSLRPLAAACLEKHPANRPTAADIMLRIVQ
ncbi:protein kinase [Planomonospora sp. ID67723]|uniref:protein kinase domain-containing protein n=1 Tax=Planomonospora sp. ID67723 TaxID=2738134 RepID=UPI0018C41D59|nr:protein kinase [Planomonospora sp. ID67723]MBG0827460.1 protein kinase [Planomonospora sp. ID67723]